MPFFVVIFIIVPLLIKLAYKAKSLFKGGYNEL
jgi:hypothetical protein